ncbi:MFS transporter [Tumebacillus avium]|nr:MFS transporter [Tumebacillus avium]
MDSRFAIFRQRSFLFYWLGYVLSQLGDVIFMITMSWMIVEVTGSGIIMGTFLMMFGIPRLAVMLIGGVMVDRYDPRKVMIYSDLLRAAVLAVILAFSIGGCRSCGFFM